MLYRQCQFNKVDRMPTPITYFRQIFFVLDLSQFLPQGNVKFEISVICYNSIIVHIVSYVDIGGQHWWSRYSLWQPVIVLFIVSYYCFIILANNFFSLSCNIAR